MTLSGTHPSASPRRLALLALLLLVPVPSLGTAAAMTLEATQGSVGRTLFAAAKVWLVLLPAVWWLLVDRGAWSLSPPRRGGFGFAVGSGLAISVVIVAVYGMLGQRLIDPATARATAEATGIAEPFNYIAFAVYICTLNAAIEEYVWRWFVFRKCETLWPAFGGRAAVLLSALFFTLHHVIALRAQFDWLVTGLGSVAVFAGGAVWSWCYLRYRSIWPGYVSHAIVDVTLFAIGWTIIVK